jgi:hypothetical protein
MDGEVICGRGKRKYFCKGGWTSDSAIARQAVSSRKQMESRRPGEHHDARSGQPE